MQIYLARNNVQAGPYTLEQVNNMLASGEVVLTDLTWHEGMPQWRPLGELTNGETFYNPNGLASNENKQEEIAKIVVIDTRSSKDKKQQEKRLTVDELYGRKPVNKESNDDKSKEQPIIKIQVSDAYHPAKMSADILASVSSRVIASLIDWALLVMILVPVFLRIDPNKFIPLKDGQLAYQNVEEMMQYLLTIFQGVPEHILIMTRIFLYAYLIIQTLLLISRGQTLGKLLMRIRILDFKTHQLASATSVVLLRVIITMFIYSLAFPLFLMIDYLFMLINRNNRSLHDKLAGTVVVKENDSQLKKKSESDK